MILKDRHVCGAEGPVHQAWIDLSGDRIGGVLIHLDAKPQPRSLKTKRVEIDQRNCTFVPRVVAVAAGSSVRFGNSDALLHNVHLMDEAGRTVANWAMPAKGQTTSWIALRKAGRYRVGCDAGHAWMNAHIFVFEHPHFVLSDGAGRFVLKRVPAGRHRLLAWHPDLGPRETTIEVPAKGRVEVQLEF